MATRVSLNPVPGTRHSLLLSAVLVAVTIGPPPATAQPNWTTPPQTPATGPMPQSIAVGDFNGDGIPDLAVGQSSAVAFFLGNGDGTFKTAFTYGTPFTNQAMAAAAFVPGQPLGLLLVSGSAANSNNALLVLSDGSGAEMPESPFSLPFGSASSVAAADFTGSGKPGFAVTFHQANKVSIFLGNGNGTFQAPVTYATGNAPSCVAVGNFNGNGFRDLAITNSGDNTVTILLSNGDGTFTAAPTVSVASSVSGSQPVGVAVADFNGDGISDLAVVKNGIDSVAVLLGQGGGKFGTPTLFPMVSGNSAIGVGDFTGSGVIDIATINPSQNLVSVLLGDGFGDFTPGNPAGTGSSPVAIAAGNFNGTGGADLAVVNGISDSLTILLSHVTNSSPTPTPTPTPTPNPGGGGGVGGTGGSSARLINISTRAQVGTGGNILIPGFVIGGSGTETLLIRADGPALSKFGVTGVLAQPSLSVYNSAGTAIASNTGWGTNGNAAAIASTAASIGAFALTPGSADCALVASLPAGAYTVQISGVNSTSGVALAEVYEVSASGTRLVNISTRAQVGTGGNIIIPGFVISGSGTDQLLVRADGPSLAQFGVTGILAQPSLSVYNGASAVIASNTAWGTASNPTLIASTAASVGAFAFASGSADSAQIVNLAAGAYTIQVSGVNNTTGVALAEVYEVPQN